MSSAQRVVKNTGILYAKMAITVFISLYSTRLVLSALGLSDFGVFNLVGGAIAMLTFLNSAMSAATQRFMSYSEGAGDQEKKRGIFNVSVALHLLIAVVVLILLEGAGYFLFHGVFNIPAERIESAKMVYQFMAVSTLFTIISVPYDAVINTHENMLLYSVLGVLEAILKLAIAFYIMYTQFDRLVTYGFLIAMLSVFLLVIRRIYCHRKYDECVIDFRKYFDRKIFKELSSFAGWSFLGSSTSMLTHYGQGIIMNTFFGPKVNTAQGVASQITGQLGSFALTMLKALNPIIDKSEGAGNRQLMLKASTMGSKMSFLLLTFFYIPVLIEMPYIFKLWLTSVPEYAVIFCRFLLMRNLIEQLVVTLSSSIGAVGNIKKYQIYTSILNCLPLIICYLLFKSDYPPYVLYIVYIGYSILTSVITLHFAAEYCGLSISSYIKDVIFRCVGTFILIMTISILPKQLIEESLLRFMLTFLLSTLSYVVLVWLICFSVEERDQIKLLLISLAKKIGLQKS